MATEQQSLAFLEQAVDMARRNVFSGRGGPFAALIVKDGEIVASGVNEVTSRQDPTAHAEVMAIRAAAQKLGSFELHGCEIYASCEPCPMCLGAIYWARLERAFYAASAADAARGGFDDSHIYQQIAVPHAQRDIPMLQIPVPDAYAPFREWTGKTDKVPY